MDPLTQLITFYVRAEIELVAAQVAVRRYGTSRQEKNLEIASNRADSFRRQLDEEIKRLRHPEGSN